ncbi:MAG: DNA polymerase III subunit gamma/tau [Muribaculaceae bacterium]|nr:DNA polymerase III subunit gamma/tau [Muribaculaceae bacterium]
MSSEQYIVSARKYRPANFSSVVGQRALTATLKNAILGGKLAQAYLFCGPRGVGKTSCARIFAKTINCLHPTSDGEACGECESCQAIEKGNSFNLIELDAASNNSVDNIRNISEQVNIASQDGRYRVFIIDEVHMLSNSAFNAFLKTLEEPPRNVIFILATTERHKVIPTILSRCQIYDFRRITVADITDHLEEVAKKEGINAEREALGVIALKADGAMRDALSIFDQVVASTHGNVTYKSTIEALNVLDQEFYFRLIDIFKEGDIPAALLTLKEVTDKGFDMQFFINGLAEHIRNLMVTLDPRTVSLLETSEEWSKKYLQQAPQFPVEWYYSAIKILNETDFNYRTSGNKRLLVELALIRLSRLLTPTSETLKSNNSQTPDKAPTPPFEVPTGSNKPQAVRPNIHKAPLINEIKKTYSKEPSSTKQTSVRPASFRISKDKDTISKGKDIDPQNQPFTEEDLNKKWEEYIGKHPEQRILIAAMRSSKPGKIDDTTYRVMVDHPAQKQAFESALPELLSFFKEKLHNDFVGLQISISEKEDKDKGLNKKEFLKLAVDENPLLADFLKAIDAELE